MSTAQYTPKDSKRKVHRFVIIVFSYYQTFESFRLCDPTGKASAGSATPRATSIHHPLVTFILYDDENICTYDRWVKQCLDSYEALPGG